MHKIKEICNKYKSEVFVSVITAFICFILKNIYLYLKDTGSKFIDLFGNFIYYQMSKINDIDLIVYFSGMLLSILLCFPLLTILINYMKKSKVEKQSTKKLTLYNNKIKKIVNILAVIDIILLVFFTLEIVYCLDKKHKFDLKMTAIKPYIEQNEYDKFYSRWVTMYRKEDYKYIQNDLLKIECEYLIKDEKRKNILCK